MASKKNSPAKIISEARRARQRISLETKLEIIRRSEKGSSGASIARQLGLRDSTVRTILKNGARFKLISEQKASFKSDKRTRSIKIKSVKRPIISKTVSHDIEKTLTSWYANEARKGNIIDLEEFQSKALSIYTDLTKDHTNAGLFTPSTELFNFCKQRFSSVISDVSSEAASADDTDINSVATNICEVIEDNNTIDMQSTNAFVQRFHEIVEEGGYTPLQIFNVSETCLFWKRLPTKHLNSKLETKDAVEHLTVLLGCNAGGDFKLKPLLINLTENPKALSGYPKDKLPVIWKSNKKALVTQLIFSDWFTSYFCPSIEQYCLKNNLANKALLVIDSSAGHPTSLDDLSGNVKVIYLPPNVSPLLQPLDETFMKIFKANYQYKALLQALIQYENSENKSFEEIWKSYDIKKAINNITEAWNEIKPSTMNKIWNQLYPNCVIDFLGFEDNIEKIFESISETARDLKLGDIDMHYYQEELGFSSNKIKNEEWLVLNQKNTEDSENDDDIIQIKSLSATSLGEAIKNLEKAMAIFSDNDPDSERSWGVCYTIRNAISSYRQLYREKVKSTELAVIRSYSNRVRCFKMPERVTSSPGSHSSNSNDPQPSNIPLDVKLEFSPAQSPSNSH